jgi:hypothetical protein
MQTELEKHRPPDEPKIPILVRYEADGESGLLDKRLEGCFTRGAPQASAGDDVSEWLAA